MYKTLIAFFIFIFSSCGRDVAPYERYKGVTLYPPQEGACDFFEKSKRIDTFWFGTRDFQPTDVQMRMPIEYFNSSSIRFAKKERFDGNVLVQLRITDFAPFPSKHSAAWKFIGDGGAKPNGRILYGVGAASIQTLKQFSKGASTEITDRAFINEVLSYTPDDNGLLNVPHYYYNTKELFVSVEDNQISSFFVCSVVKESNFPQCSQYLSIGDLGLRISFNRKYLVDWRSIQERARNFTKCTYIQTIVK